MSKSGDVLSELVQLKCIIDGGLGAPLPDAGGFGGWGNAPAAGQFF